MCCGWAAGLLTLRSANVRYRESRRCKHLGSRAAGHDVPGGRGSAAVQVLENGGVVGERKGT